MEAMMTRRIVPVLALFLALTLTPTVSVAADDEMALTAKWRTDSQWRTDHTNKALASGYTAGDSITSDALQAVAQVVVKRAMQAGWAQLGDVLTSLAKCKDATPRLPSTCQVLTAARIQDVLATPKPLLDAFVSDVLAKAGPKAAVAIGGGSLLVEAWLRGGASGVVTAVKAQIRTLLRTQAATLACPANPSAVVPWAVVSCFALHDSVTPLADLVKCPFDEVIAACSLSTADQASVLAVLQLGARSLASDKDAAVALQFFFEWGKLAAPAASVAIIDDLEAVFVGVAQHDWLQTIRGISGLAKDAINTPGCEEGKCTLENKLVKILGSVGVYAETYSSSKSDPAAAATARANVIEDLVTSLTSRTGREHGAVVSLGGALGGFAGRRLNDNGSEWAFPLRLTLGVGLQTYWWKEWGFHASIDAFDLGQYVTYSKGDLQVDRPEIKSVVVVGGTAGFWLHNRETPVFLAFHGSVSPFIRTSDDKLTYELGAMLGVYVPLLDFN